MEDDIFSLGLMVDKTEPEDRHTLPHHSYPAECI
jgi:hypothetical protein